MSVEVDYHRASIVAHPHVKVNRLDNALAPWCGSFDRGSRIALYPCEFTGSAAPEPLRHLDTTERRAMQVIPAPLGSVLQNACLLARAR